VVVVTGKPDKRVVMRLHGRWAPIKAAVLPVVKSNASLVAAATRLTDQLGDRLAVEMDVTQSVGKRYRRQDEVGTPVCITVDDGTLRGGTVTLRDRDTMRQRRVTVEALLAHVATVSGSRGNGGGWFAAHEVPGEDVAPAANSGGGGAGDDA